MESKKFKTTRRNFLKLASVGIGASLTPSVLRSQPSNNFNSNDNMKLGIASYTFRKFSLDETLTMTKQLDIDWIALKSYHLP